MSALRELGTFANHLKLGNLREYFKVLPYAMLSHSHVVNFQGRSLFQRLLQVCVFNEESLKSVRIITRKREKTENTCRLERL